MSLNSLYNSSFDLYSNEIIGRNSIGGIIRGAVLKQASIDCFFTYIGGDEAYVFGKNNIPATHRLFCNPLEIETTDIVQIDGNWYDVKYIDDTFMSNHYEVKLLATKAPLVVETCSNDIDKIYCSVIIGDPGMVFNSYKTVEINGTNTKNHFIPLYDFDMTGKTASDKTFFGDSGVVVGIQTGWQGIYINGTQYFMPVFSGDATTNCCSNLVGEELLPD